MGPLGGLLGAWRVVGSRSWAAWERLGPTFRILAAPWGSLGPSSGALGPLWEARGRGTGSCPQML
eukprot:5320881-Pyramimonas_sp.AAC.1